MKTDNPFLLGNTSLLECEKIAFLSSRHVPPDAVLRAYDWATEMRDAGRCVIGGFQSALERDVLKILLEKGTQPIILVLARKMWSQVPTQYCDAIGAGRLLVVSPVPQRVNRVSEESAKVRNRWILAHCDSAVFAALDPAGSLAAVLREFPYLSYKVLSEERIQDEE